MARYESMILLTPVLSAEQAKEAAGKFRKLLTDRGAKILSEEHWIGGRGKTPGFYHLMEFEPVSSEAVADLELALKRDERVMRFLTLRLDKGTSSGEARTRFEALLSQGAESASDRQPS